jgi:hypothetical protein
MSYQTIFHPNDADPPFTLMLLEIEGQSPESALTQHLEAVVDAAHRACVEYFGAELFTRDELIRQIYVVDREGRWHAAREVVQAMRPERSEKSLEA